MKGWNSDIFSFSCEQTLVALCSVWIFSDNDNQILEIEKKKTKKVFWSERKNIRKKKHKQNISLFVSSKSIWFHVIRKSDFKSILFRKLCFLDSILSKMRSVFLFNNVSVRESREIPIWKPSWHKTLFQRSSSVI